jgi:hypothetical protein
VAALAHARQGQSHALYQVNATMYVAHSTQMNQCTCSHNYLEFKVHEQWLCWHMQEQSLGSVCSVACGVMRLQSVIFHDCVVTFPLYESTKAICLCEHWAPLSNTDTPAAHFAKGRIPAVHDAADCIIVNSSGIMGTIWNGGDLQAHMADITGFGF